MRTDLVETPLVGEDGDMSVISSAACREMVLAGCTYMTSLGLRLARHGGFCVGMERFMCAVRGAEVWLRGK